MKPPVVALSPLLLSALAWAVAMRADAVGWAPTSAMLLGADLVVLASISLIGIVMSHARWAHRLGFAVIAAEAVIAFVTSISVWWWIALAVGASALTGLAGPWLRGHVRLLPPASGPPVRAVLLTLTLVMVPGVVAATHATGMSAWGWAVAGVAALAAYAYARALPGSLIAVRLIVPLTLAASTVFEPAAAAVAAAVMAILVVGLAWTKDARLAVRPLTRRGSTVPIPPELVDPAVREAAGIDDRGAPA